MRITDDRYNRDWQRFDLALRLISHEARTCTIRIWTGLSDDRIRKLYKCYLAHSGGVRVSRHRGKPPTQVNFFQRNREIRGQAAVLGGLYSSLGLLGLHRTQAEAPPLEWSELFCDAYETYLASEPLRKISFEHAAHLVWLLDKGTELELRECPGCDSLMIHDPLRVRRSVCTFCEIDRPLGPRSEFALGGQLLR